MPETNKCPCCGQQISEGKVASIRVLSYESLSVLMEQTRLLHAQKSADPVVQEQVRRNVETFVKIVDQVWPYLQS